MSAHATTLLPLPQQPLRLLQVQQAPSWPFRAALVEIAVVNFLLAYIVQVTMAMAVGVAQCSLPLPILQVYVLETVWYRRAVGRLWRRLWKERALSGHRRIAKALERDSSWPPVVDAPGQ